MPFALNGTVRLHYEETGEGLPIIFVHEFGSDLREWEGQVRWFSRDYRCIAYNARGYPPSDVPDNLDDYGYEQSRDDIAAVMDHLGIDKAHIVGLSMGAYAALMFGLKWPERALSLVVAAGGSGSEPRFRETFETFTEGAARRFLEAGSPAVAKVIGNGPSRIQLQIKDPRGWREFVDHLSGHDATGSAHTLRRYQIGRPSLYCFEAALREMTVPTLLVLGDEDDGCLEVNLFLKRTLPAAGLWICPRTGHAVNLEEPAAFNREVQGFLSAVERGHWGLRDPRTLPR